MSEPDPIQRAVEAQQPMFTLAVVVFKDGHVQCHGPVNNELLCLQILADGMREIRRHNRERAAVIVPKLVPPGDLGRNGR